MLTGLNLDNIKKKYKKQLDVNFKESEIKDFDEENNKELYENINNFNIITADQVKTANNLFKDTTRQISFI